VLDRNVRVLLCVMWHVNHMYVISICSFRYIYQKFGTVSGSCQPLCYTYWRFCSSGSKSSRIV